jgi:outer membrane protein assembly factor BamB
MRRRLARALAGIGTAGVSAWASGCSKLDLAPGSSTQVIWHVAGMGSEGGAPGFDGTTAFFLNGTHGVVAIDAQSAVQRWSASTGTVGGGTYGEAGCITAGAVVACGDEDIIGFNRSDGSLAWRYHATMGYSPGFFSPTVVGTSLYAGSPSGTVYAIDATAGVARWATRPFPTDTELISIFDPSADNDIVVAGFTKFLPSPIQPVGGVVALDAATGQVRWIAYFPHPDSTLQTNGRSTALWQNLVLAPSAAAGTIYALDRGTGAVQWALPGVGAYPPQFNSHPATQDLRAVTVYGSTLYAISISCWLVAYDLSSRTELWRIASPDGASTVERVFSDGQAVYALYGSGGLISYSASAPSIRWTAGSSTAQFNGPVALGSDRVFATGAAGFYALSK